PAYARHRGRRQAVATAITGRDSLRRSPIVSAIRRHPPGPTLFPYATLFRSLYDLTDPREASDTTLFDRLVREPRRASLVYAVAGDRKSTRLNSSHSQISYAVFCLKKKNPVDYQNACYRLPRLPQRPKSLPRA